MKHAVCFAILLAVHVAHAADLNPDVLKKIDAAVSQSIEKKETPGGVLWIEYDGAIYSKEYGLRAIVPAEEPATRDTIYDAASLTKVIATAPAIVLLHERGKIDLEKPVAAYIPDFAKNGKEAITLRHLLTHTSGLRPGLGRATRWSGPDEALKLACAEKLQHPPGKVFVYSDINFIVLGEVVRAVSGEGLDTFTQREFYAPLKMMDTSYLPAQEKSQRIAPTEKQPDDFGVRGEKKGAWLRGAVHDPTARRMNGVAGHAGVFTTASDLARFARMLLNKGELDGVRVLKPESVALLTTVQAQAALPDRDDAPAVSRALGFDIVSPYDGPRGSLYPKTSFGHTGWTGTSVWIDPTSKSFVIFLANRNHPDGKGDLRALRRTLGTLAAEATK
jgi:CubicO group peptidase (beta-lactamase class C family)